MTRVMCAPVTSLNRACLPIVDQGQAGRWRIEQPAKVVEEFGLVLFSDEQIITTCLPHLLAECVSAEQGIAGEDPTSPIKLGNELWRHREFCFSFLAPVLYGHLANDDL